MKGSSRPGRTGVSFPGWRPAPDLVGELGSVIHQPSGGEFTDGRLAVGLESTGPHFHSETLGSVPVSTDVTCHSEWHGSRVGSGEEVNSSRDHCRVTGCVSRSLSVGGNMSELCSTDVPVAFKSPRVAAPLAVSPGVSNVNADLLDVRPSPIRAGTEPSVPVRSTERILNRDPPAGPADIGDTTVVTPIQSLVRSLYAAIPRYDTPVPGRVHGRLRSPHGRGSGIGAVVRRRSRATPPLSGIPGQNPCDSALAESFAQPQSPSRDGRGNDCMVHKPAKRSSLSGSRRTDARRLPDCVTAGDSCRGTSLSGVSEGTVDHALASRPVGLSRSGASSRRVRNTASDGVSHTITRADRCTVHSPAPAGASPVPGPTSRVLRRARVRFGRDGRLCFAADSSTTANPAPGTAARVRDSVHSAHVAEQVAGPGPNRDSGLGADTAPRAGGSTDPPARTTTPSRRKSLGHSRVDVVKQNLRCKGFARRSTRAYVKMHRDSTVKAYNARWITFTKWCKQHHIHKPEVASVPNIARFLSYLRDDRNLSGGSIANYLSAIGTVRDIATGVVLAKDTVLRGIIKGFKQQDVRKTRFRAPAWDLNLVLQALTKEPFEPLDSASLQHVTWKTAFLLSLATAARVSELHALDITAVRFDRGDTGAVHLGLLMDFVAKNQKYGQVERMFTIRSLNEIVGPDMTEDRTLCPVRALKEYVRRTEPHRNGRARLFISCNPNRSAEITRNTLALWLRKTISFAYRQSGVPQCGANPHEIRAWAATVALHSNISVQRIIRGCFWKSDSVFANHYLRRLSASDVHGVSRLGPLVAAQNVCSGAT